MLAAVHSNRNRLKSGPSRLCAKSREFIGASGFDPKLPSGFGLALFSVAMAFGVSHVAEPMG